jgi:hypothetical protein
MTSDKPTNKQYSFQQLRVDFKQVLRRPLETTTFVGTWLSELMVNTARLAGSTYYRVIGFPRSVELSECKDLRYETSCQR